MKDKSLPLLHYRDKYLRVALSIISATFLVLYGEEPGLWEALHDLTFYTSVLMSLPISLILIYSVYKISSWLDSRYDWQSDFLKRLSLQLFLGIAVPGMLAILFAILYFLPFDMDIRNNGYLRYDFPVILLLITLLNTYYVFYYTIMVSGIGPKLRRQLYNSISSITGTVSDKGFTEDLAISLSTIPGDRSIDAESGNEKEYLLIRSGALSRKINVLTEVCFFYRAADTTWLQTFTGEKVFITQSLKSLEELFGEKEFFRINRWVIINRSAILGFSEGPSRTLQINLKPEFQNLVEEGTFTNVSQDKYAGFKTWIAG